MAIGMIHVFKKKRKKQEKFEWEYTCTIIDERWFVSSSFSTTAKYSNICRVMKLPIPVICHASNICVKARICLSSIVDIVWIWIDVTISRDWRCKIECHTHIYAGISHSTELNIDITSSSIALLKHTSFDIHFDFLLFILLLLHHHRLLFFYNSFNA